MKTHYWKSQEVDIDNKHSAYFTREKIYASLISCLQSGNDIKVLVVCVYVKMIGDSISKALITVFGRNSKYVGFFVKNISQYQSPLGKMKHLHEIIYI